MSDERLRELERRWKETCATQDEAAYLVERTRSGELDQNRLELAAYLGHAASLVALGDEAPEVLTADDLPPYRLRLDQGRSNMGYLEEVGAWWGQEFCIRFAIAAATHAANRWEERRPDGVEALHVARACISRAEAWTLNPTRETSMEIGPLLDSNNNLSWAIRGPHHIANVAKGPPGWKETTYSHHLARTVLAATRIAVSSRKAQRAEREALLDLTREDLAPWALGYFDPVRDRVAARQREAGSE